MNKEELYTVHDIEDDEIYTLSEWGCLYGVLNDYGIDISHIPGKVGKHIVEDFMELITNAGYVEKKKKEEE